VGFKWFLPVLFEWLSLLGGEESAGASFLRHNGTAGRRDKTAANMALLAASSRAHREKTLASTTGR